MNKWANAALLAMAAGTLACEGIPSAPTEEERAQRESCPVARRVKDLRPGQDDGLHLNSEPSELFSMHALGSELVFRAWDGVNPPALWRSDAT